MQQNFQQGFSQMPNRAPQQYIGFVEAIQICFNKYACFSGRAGRAEYWWFMLFAFLVSIVTGGSFSFMGTFGGTFGGLISLALLIPSLAVSWRRMHDIGKGGGWYFIGLIPLVGWIIWIIWCVKESEPMPNRFGDIPA